MLQFVKHRIALRQQFVSLLSPRLRPAIRITSITPISTVHTTTAPTMPAAGLQTICIGDAVGSMK
jgi:hypothetical protein